ncbi:MAG TPA: hypothetical protein VGX48_15765 [Pyrinomonadaceae bacterium]|jgi:hypothetical protein|nr:hypothetical protein [Pyrinomonadaceae bacterium]
MALIDQVRKVCERLAPHGWADLLALHGLDIKAADLRAELAKELPNIRRGVGGFEDFAHEGKRGVEPGHPARSLLYHALASTNVMKKADGSSLTVFPTLAELEAVENYVFGAAPPTLQELRARAGGAPLAVVVFAYEYRPAWQTCHKKHADLVFSRTGVSRVGTKEAHYDGSRRGFLPTDEADPFAIRVSPARYGAYLAVRVSGNPKNFCPMRFIIPAANAPDGKGDDQRQFWLPVHKLFPGDECLKGTAALQVELRARHVNQKLRRIHLELRRTHTSGGGAPFDTGWNEPDLSQPPFVFTEGIAEWSRAPEHGAGVLLPVVHPSLVERAQYKGKPLSFNVPKNVEMLSSSMRIPWDGDALRAPEYVHIRHKVQSNGSIVDLNSRRDVEQVAGAGGYRALHYLDFTGDGWVEARCPQLTQPGAVAAFVPAYSLVTAPDFFPTCDQRELTEWTDTLPKSLRKAVWRIPPDTLSDQRMAPNLQLPGGPFRPGDTTATAIVSVFGEVSAQQTLAKPTDTSRHSHLPDDSAGFFAPGWDVSRDEVNGNWHLSSYGLGSPFPEDAKLCAALSTFWPAAAPDATRTFTYGAEQDWKTVSPLTDEEIGQVGNLPWDGVPGPRVVTSNGEQFADYPSFAHTDYVQNALDNKFSIRVTSHIDLEEYQSRSLAMAQVHKALGGKPTDWVVLSFRLVTAGDPELQQAQAAAQMTLPGDAYRFVVFRKRATEPPGAQFRRRRIKITGRVTLFCDPQHRRVLLKPDGGAWGGREIADT